MLRPLGVLALLLALAFVASPLATAGPFDAKVGETRLTYKADGTSLREQGTKLSKAVAVLPYGTRCRILEVKQPWIRVQTPQGTGWVRSAETVEPAALSQNPAPIDVRGASGGTSQRDISAAGRQFDAATEQRYRQNRQDLASAYRAVDQMERDTQQLHPAESVAFIVGGALGRRGQDYARPPRLPPTQRVGSAASSSQPSRGGGLPGGLGGLLGGAAEAAGLKRRHGEALGQALGAAAEYQKQLKEKFLPEQEYFLGRAVAAHAIAKYGVDPNPKRRHYVKLVGDAIVRLSTRLPRTYGGYHFELLDSDEINAVSGPGGFVLITRGVVQAARSEDELAAVIAHELAHVKHQDGEKTLRNGRAFPQLLGNFGRAVGTATKVGSERWGQAVLDLFTKVVDEAARTAIEHSYGRAAEFGADLEGTYLLVDVVYDHAAMRDFLQVLASRPGGTLGKAATHTPPQYRIAQLNPVIQRYGPFRGTDRVKEIRAERVNEANGR